MAQTGGYVLTGGYLKQGFHLCCFGVIGPFVAGYVPRFISETMRKVPNPQITIGRARRRIRYWRKMTNPNNLSRTLLAMGLLEIY